MLLFLKLLRSNLTAYFFGRALYCNFYDRKEKSELISKVHSFFLGLSVTSISFWFYTIITNGNNVNYPLIETIFVFFIYFQIKRAKIKPFGVIQINKKLIHKNALFHFIGFTIILLISFLILIRCLRFPDGAWDAISMWNFKAKFLVSGEDTWSGMFSETFDYIHRGYPLFLPNTISRSYIYTNNISPIIPSLFNYIFCISCFILVYLYLNKLKNIFYGIFSLCILVFSNYLFTLLGNQYADIPLSIYILISIYELINWDKNNNNLPWLCILYASNCFWIKNEGIPWFIIYTIYLFILTKQKGITNKKIALLLLAFFPYAFSRLIIKYLSNENIDLPFHYSFDSYNFFNQYYYYYIGSYCLDFIKNHIWIFIIPAYIFFDFKSNKYKKYFFLLIIIFLMYTLYTILYFFIPHDIESCLKVSFPRITSTLIPSLVFLGALFFSMKNKPK